MLDANGVTAIGWRVLDQATGQRPVKINSAKDKSINPVEEDGLIVVGKSV